MTRLPLPGFEQNDYVREAGFDNYPLADLLDEFERLRRANMVMIQNMPEAHADRRGTASGFPVSARALIYVLVGHVDTSHGRPAREIFTHSRYVVAS